MDTAFVPLSLPPGGDALVIGASGGIGGAFLAALTGTPRFARVIGLGRGTVPPLDITDEASIAAALAALAPLAPRLVVDATGMLHTATHMPERTWRQLDPTHMAQAFAVNAIGPMLLMKHLLPLLPREGKSVFATLSAKVGSIGDNALGGWYSYRASKAALNQFVRTAAIELRRSRPHAVCVALHPGTVETPLSAPFARTGLDVRPPAEAAARMLAVLDALGPADSGGFFDYRGGALPW
ncbi:MAG: SDR family oxidoreductase [Proteobacteria bacterium]|nr:SDR family oxidoreductase [Pseudomonadota bacterium]